MKDQKPLWTQSSSQQTSRDVRQPWRLCYNWPQGENSLCRFTIIMIYHMIHHQQSSWWSVINHHYLYCNKSQGSIIENHNSRSLQIIITHIWLFRYVMKEAWKNHKPHCLETWLLLKMCKEAKDKFCYLFPTIILSWPFQITPKSGLL